MEVDFSRSKKVDSSLLLVSTPDVTLGGLRNGILGEPHYSRRRVSIAEMIK